MTCCWQAEPVFHTIPVIAKPSRATTAQAHMVNPRLVACTSTGIRAQPSNLDARLCPAHQGKGVADEGMGTRYRREGMGRRAWRAWLYPPHLLV